MLISLHIDRDNDKAMQMLEQAGKDFPNRPDELISLYGHLNPKDPSCVNYFKQSIRAHADDPYSFGGLLRYFVSTTFEYGKAIEVSTKALSGFSRKLLGKIVRKDVKSTFFVK